MNKINDLSLYWLTFKQKFVQILGIITLTIVAIFFGGSVFLNFLTPTVTATSVPITNAAINQTEPINEPLSNTSSLIIAQSQTETSNTELTELNNDSKDLVQQQKEYFNKTLAGFGLFNVFIIFFVTLGPLKIVPPFVRLTQNATTKLRQQLAIRSFTISTIVIILVALLSQNILSKWQVRVPSVLIAAGILLFLVSLDMIMSQYKSSKLPDVPVEPSLNLVINPLVFPTILTPYGIALVITLSAIFGKLQLSIVSLIGLLVLVMFLNLMAMLTARPILNFVKPTTLQVIGFVIGVLQLALGIDFILGGIQIEAVYLKFLLS